ncbi:uncharacterized protein TNCV_4608891 [Trichonephila clavipes]|nr:uncharacterized protein TNCV_4608891 [Trichonephila clavipes]
MPVHMSPRLSNPILIRSRYSFFLSLRIRRICHRLNMCGVSLGGRLARDLRPVVSIDEFWLRIQTIWNTLPQADIQNLLNSMPRRVAALIVVRGGHTKYYFLSLLIVCLV